jgi:isoleucyl-tRNA synthetase
MVISTILFDKAPWKNLIVNGLVLAADGKKMSKSLKNYPDPNLILQTDGADALRYDQLRNALWSGAASQHA